VISRLLGFRASLAVVLGVVAVAAIDSIVGGTLAIMRWATALVALVILGITSSLLIKRTRRPLPSRRHRRPDLTDARIGDVDGTHPWG
jgi:hypothetical protein